MDCYLSHPKFIGTLQPVASYKASEAGPWKYLFKDDEKRYINYILFPEEERTKLDLRLKLENEQEGSGPNYYMLWHHHSLAIREWEE